jgi:thioredoxin-like negative regulator of GroEL
MLFLPVAVHAASEQAFTAQAFKAAQDAGKPILVEIHADWCPTCKAQQPVLNKLSGEKACSNDVRFKIDFDSQKDLLRQFNAKTQSTLVLYKGRTEIARSVGETDESRLRAMLQKAF